MTVVTHLGSSINVESWNLCEAVHIWESPTNVLLNEKNDFPEKTVARKKF